MFKRIYLDYASLTPIDSRVLAEIEKYSGTQYANPSSIYAEGVSAKKVVENSKKSIAEFLNGHDDEIIFTSGGTEANNLAILGALEAYRKTHNEKPHFITSNIEHSSVLEIAKHLANIGVEVTVLNVDSKGQLPIGDLKKALRPNTFMASLMIVNNEIGSVAPIHDMAKEVRHYRNNITKTVYPLFHTDAAQAATYCDLNVENLGVDLLTLDAGKVYGPRGIGALYVKRKTPLINIMFGGGQERGLRSGTENVPAIAGLAKALQIVRGERSGELMRIQALKELFYHELKSIDAKIQLNPSSVDVSDPILAPHILNVHIPDIDNEFFVLRMDAKGVAISTKSSCLRDEDESYVLKAIGSNSKESVRFSLGRYTKKGDVKKVVRIIKKLLK